MDKSEIWAQALVKLQSEVSTISYDLWIKSLEPIDFKNGSCEEMWLAYNIAAWNSIGDPNTERGIYFL